MPAERQPSIGKDAQSAAVPKGETGKISFYSMAAKFDLYYSTMGRCALVAQGSHSSASAGDCTSRREGRLA
jgi:hypothetical protein